MAKPMRLDEFTRLPARVRATSVAGLTVVIDRVAEGAAVEGRLLRYHFFAADAAERGSLRTLVIEADGVPVIALPLVGGRRGYAEIAGPPWPWRGFPARLEADGAAFDALVDALGRETAALAIGPAHEDDHAIGLLLDAAQRRGWTIDSRRAAAHRPPASAEIWDQFAVDPVVAALIDTDRKPSASRCWLIARPGLAGWRARRRWRAG